MCWARFLTVEFVDAGVDHELQVRQGPGSEHPPKLGVVGLHFRHHLLQQVHVVTVLSLGIEHQGLGEIKKKWQYRGSTNAVI